MVATQKGTCLSHKPAAAPGAAAAGWGDPVGLLGDLHVVAAGALAEVAVEVPA